MALTSAQRSALPASDFAVPGKRVLPIHDKDHVKMAWSTIGEARGLSETEIGQGRIAIMAKADTLGMDTKDWKLANVNFVSAMCLDTPSTPDHPNKAPFSGILVRLDQQSDAAPHGTSGMKTILTRAAAEAALDSLLGMGVNCQCDLKGHDKKVKIGIIDSATIETDGSGDYIKIGGFIYASDFKEIFASIQMQKDALGFSFEAERLYVSQSKLPNTLEIEKLFFTGAAILYKKDAAYKSTSIAANADKEIVMDEELKTMLTGLSDGIKGLGQRLEVVEAKGNEGAAILAAAQPLTTELRSIAGKLMAAKIGTTPVTGHVAILNAMADQIDQNASRGLLASAYVLPAAAAAADDKGENKEVKELKDSIASLTTQITDLKAAAATSKEGAPERKSIPATLTTLMAKAGVTLEGEDKKMSIATLDGVLATSKLDPQSRMQLKIGMRNAGLLEAA